MAATSALIEVSGNGTSQHADTVTLTYRVIYDSVPTNFYSALAAAQSAAGSAVPARRSLYAGAANLFCSNLSGKVENLNDSRAVWLWTATFTTPPPGEQDPEQQNENPLLRPPKINVRYMERERVIDQARNWEELPKGDGDGGNRPINHIGPIVNSAGIRPDEPQVDTERLEVLVIEKNYPSLSAIVTRNRTYKRTTNLDSPQGYAARELRYLLTESLGKQFENGIEFWPGVTEILADKTTDLILDNVGYQAYVGGVLTNLKDANGDPLAEPVNLKLDGTPGEANSTITYRYLDEVPYAPLFA